MFITTDFKYLNWLGNKHTMEKNHCTTEHTQFCNSNLHSCISSPISTFNKFLMSLNLVELNWLAKQDIMIHESVNQLEEIYKRTKKTREMLVHWDWIFSEEAFLFLCFYNLNKRKVSWLEQIFNLRTASKQEISYLHITPYEVFL